MRKDFFDKPAIVIAATFTAEPLLPSLQFVLRRAGLDLDVRFSQYHQVFQELLSPASLLATNASGVDVVLVRIEDFVRDVRDPGDACATVKRASRELGDALTRHSHRVKIPTVLAVLPPSPRARALRFELERANADLLATVGCLPGVTLLTSEEIERVFEGEHYDSLSDELAHIPFTDEYYASLSIAIARKAHALLVSPQKVLVLDCDETLWRGVLGEDGITGITIPKAFSGLQKFAVDVHSRGVLVCLISKNSERDVLDVFAKRLDMVLKLEHIVAHRINWEDKPKNLVALARTLNLGLDAFVYIDDNPVECALMRAQLPQVVTLQLPPENEIASFLSHLWTFDKVTITDEDVRRTSMYRENAARREHEESTTDIAEFIASLELAIDIAPPGDREWARVAQLTHRTNQFNFTTIRRTEPEMRALPATSRLILRVNVKDRFGDYGLVGVVITDVIADTLVVDTLLLSCRVLGRGVEHAILRRLGEIAKEHRLAYVSLRYLPTDKNEPARAFAESVAANFRMHEQDRIVYRIPVGTACAITHRPGHDPAAIIEALKSEERKGSGSASVLTVNRSQRYEDLARVFVSGRHMLQAIGHATTARALPGKPKPPTTVVEGRLLTIWQRLLGINELGVEDNYFALGGTSLLAAKLIVEITRQFGVKLPLTVILEAPTVRALARLLEHNRMRMGALVELRKGGPRNLFLVHDGDGETLLYLNLARRMPQDFTVFGIEPRRIAGVPLAHTSIEDMATFYLKELRAKQPQGPYLLGGMCAGAVIAYEMASQLVRLGESVELVALLDAATPQAPRRAGRITKRRLERIGQTFAGARTNRKFVASQVAYLIGTMSSKLVHAMTWEIMQLATHWWAAARFHLLRQLLARQTVWPPILPSLTTREIYECAEARYVPKPQSGLTIALVRARSGEEDDTPYREIYADQTFGWGAVADNLTVIDVDGGHSSMLREPFVASLATALMPYVRREHVARTYSVEMASP
jgi:FkbH-like protein